MRGSWAPTLKANHRANYRTAIAHLNDDNMRFSVKQPRIATWCFFITAALTITRFLVLFFESYSVVRAERQADISLIDLCTAGMAKESEKFRLACLQARSEQAAPVFLKAILKAIKTAFSDFSECFNSPSRIAILLLFCLSGLAMPVVKALSALATSFIGQNGTVSRMHFGDDDDDDGCHQIVVLENENRTLLNSMANRLRTFPMRKRRNRLPSLADIEEDVIDDAHLSNAWTTVKLGKSN